jgi:hypothetical protein
MASTLPTSFPADEDAEFEAPRRAFSLSEASFQNTSIGREILARACRCSFRLTMSSGALIVNRQGAAGVYLAVAVKSPQPVLEWPAIYSPHFTLAYTTEWDKDWTSYYKAILALKRLLAVGPIGDCSFEPYGAMMGVRRDTELHVLLDECKDVIRLHAKSAEFPSFWHVSYNSSKLSF